MTSTEPEPPSPSPHRETAGRGRVRTSMALRFLGRALFVVVPLALWLEGGPEPSLQPTDAFEPYRNELQAPKPPPPRLEELCGLVGCDSAVSFTAHLREHVTALAGRASFRVCRRDQCWNGTLQHPRANALSTWPCSVPTSFALQLRCDFEEEGTGSKLSLSVVEGGPFEDGDPVSLHVSLGGRTLIDHSRRVTYGEDAPNGRTCGPICRNASVELWPSAPTGVSCGPGGSCNPVVRFDSMFPVTRDGAGRTRIIACRNDACESTTDGVILYEWDDVKDEPIPRANGGAGLASVGGARVSIREWSLSRPSTAPYHVEVQFTGDPRTYQAGDRYSVEWQSLSGKVLLHEERVVGRYEEWSPGGPGCSAEPCRAKDFRQ